MPAGVTGGPGRVFMTADAVGGVWQYALELAGGLAARGVGTVLAAVGPLPAPARAREAERVPGLRLLQTGLPLEWTAAAPGEVEAAAARLSALAGRSGAAVAHLNTPAYAAVPWPVPVVAVAHSCVGTWWRRVRGGEPPADVRWRMECHAAGLAAADEAVAPSRAFAAETEDLYHLGRTLSVVRNGRTPLRRDRAKTRFVLTAGRLWDEGKNIALLDRVAPQLKAPVVAAGPRTGPDGGRADFQNLCLTGTLGADALADWMAAAGVYAAPARYEPFGLGVLEAAATGAALVLSDIPTFRELWDGAARFVDPDDEAGWAARLGVLLADAAAARRLGAAARRRACRYSVDAMTDGMLRAYAAVGAAVGNTVTGSA